MITLKSINGATEQEEKMIRGALAVLNVLWTSETLHQAILKHTKFDSSPGFENTDDTCEQIWQKMQTEEIVLNDTVYSPSFWERLRGDNVVGYEDDDGIHQNRDFLDDDTTADIADNLGHEGLHGLGYTHDFNATAIRPYSVPYGIGEIIRTLLMTGVRASQLRASPVTPGDAVTANLNVTIPLMPSDSCVMSAGALMPVETTGETDVLGDEEEDDYGNEQ